MKITVLIISVLAISACAGTHLNVNSSGSASLSTPVELGIAQCRITANGSRDIHYGLHCHR